MQSVGPQWGRQKQGHGDSNQDPELSPRGVWKALACPSGWDSEQATGIAHAIS